MNETEQYWQSLALPGYDPWRDAGDTYKFKPDIAVRKCSFFEKCLTHSLGKMHGKPFLLEDWERAIIGNLFGWVNVETGNRRYRESLVFVARKNGKTHLGAGIALVIEYDDGEKGAHVYSTAANADQARIVFDAGKQMVLGKDALKNRAEIFKDSIVLKGTNSFWKVLNSEAGTKHGLNPHAVLVDELHAIPDRELVDVLVTGTAYRTQPLIVYMTTAGYDKQSICYEKYTYAKQVQEGVICDPTFLPVIYEAAPDDDWTQPETWRKANPNLGVSVQLEYLERECQRAQDVTTYENTFRRLHLNQWTEMDERWLPMDVWNRAKVDEPDLKGKPCHLGLDLSSTGDLTALSALFTLDNGSYLKHFAWIPSENAAKREKMDRVPYLTWARSGDIEMTDGNGVDYSVIRAKVNELAQEYDVRAIGVDQWNAEQLCQQLEEDGYEVEKLNMSYSHLSAASKELMRGLVEQEITHDGNPVATWCASNVVIEHDAADNIRPSKKKSTERIDCVVADIIAIAEKLGHPEGDSIYNSRGMVEI